MDSSEVRESPSFGWSRQNESLANSLLSACANRGKSSPTDWPERGDFGPREKALETFEPTALLLIYGKNNDKHLGKTMTNTGCHFSIESRGAETSHHAQSTSTQQDSCRLRMAIHHQVNEPAHQAERNQTSDEGRYKRVPKSPPVTLVPRIHHIKCEVRMDLRIQIQKLTAWDNCRWGFSGQPERICRLLRLIFWHRAPVWESRLSWRTRSLSEAPHESESHPPSWDRQMLPARRDNSLGGTAPHQ